MEQIKLSEANSEVLVFLDRNFPTRLSALEEAARVIQRECIREGQRAIKFHGETA